MKLLVSQKDQLFNIIDENPFFTPSQFEIQEVNGKSGVGTKIIYLDTDFSFSYLSSRSFGSWDLHYSPGNEQFLDVSFQNGWNQSLLFFRKWIEFLNREVSSPNFWEKFKREINKIDVVTSKDNSKFSYTEFTQLSNEISGLKLRISEVPLSQEQFFSISSQLDRITELAKDLGKFDWQNLFLGTVLSTILQTGINQENTKLIWSLIKAAFSNYFIN